MAINYWRHIGDDYDNPESQCLQCYGKLGCWIAPNWVYCPLCGTKWLGQWPSEEIRNAQEEREYAIQRRRNELYERTRTRPSRAWVLGKRELIFWPNEPVKVGPWQHYCKVNGGAADALILLKQIRDQDRSEEDPEPFGTVRIECELRANLVGNNH